MTLTTASFAALLSSMILKSKLQKPWVRALQVILVVVTVFFVGHRISLNWNDIQEHDWNIEYGMLALSIVVMVLAFYIQSSVLSRIFRAFSRDIGPNKAFKIAYLSQLGRYIPGKIWQVFGMVHFSRVAGVPASEAVGSFILHQLFGTPPALGIIALNMLLFDFIPGEEFLTGTISIVLLAASTLSIFLLFCPRLLKNILNRILRAVGVDQISFDLAPKEAVTMLVIYFIGWTVFGLSFHLFVLSISAGGGIGAFQTVGIYCAAYLVGFWSILTPGGIGVREALLALLLTPFYGAGVAAAIATAARVWSIAGEIIASAVALRIK